MYIIYFFMMINIFSLVQYVLVLIFISFNIILFASTKININNQFNWIELNCFSFFFLSFFVISGLLKMMSYSKGKKGSKYKFEIRNMIKKNKEQNKLLNVSKNGTAYSLLCQLN